MAQLSLGIVREEKLDIAWNKANTAIVFTIAPNGHVISREIDDAAEGKGQKNDIELEIFAPGGFGYLLWRRGEKYSKETRDKLSLTLGSQRLHEVSLTQCQREKITVIVSQAEEIQRMLGTLMDNGGQSYLESYESHSSPRNPSPQRSDSVSNRKKLRLIECSYKYPQNKWNFSALNIWKIEYDNVSCSFLFSQEYHPDHAGKWPHDIKDGREYIKEGTFYKSKNGHIGDIIVPSVEDPYIRTDRAHIPQLCYRRRMIGPDPYVMFYAVQAENKQFDFASADAVVKRNFVAPHLRVMHGVENIFDCYEIDDAVLLLEEVRLSETISELHWTLAIAHNTLLRNFKRIVSNNLFLRL